MRNQLLLSILFIIATTQVNLKAQCLAGNCGDGFGIKKFENEDKYVGEFKNHKRHGQGTYLFSDGYRYSGTWKNDLYDGEGRFYDKTGVVLKQGFWKEGNLTKKQHTVGCLSGDCLNGYGVYLTQEGTKIITQFKNGQPTEISVLYYPNGEKFIGKIQKGQKNGNGVLYNTNGLIEEGVWLNDEMLGASKTPKGCLEGDCQNGRGIYIYRNNTRYEGTFKNSKANGFGICFYANGDLYIGSWNNHLFHEKGTYYYTDGTILEGTWKNGNFLGVTNEETTENSPFFDVFEEEKTQPTAEKNTKIWAIIIGVARYNNMRSLKYTDDDAYRFHSFLKSPEGGALPDEQIALLIDEDATQENVMKNIRRIVSQVAKEDAVIFFFSGHGVKGAFLPTDYDGIENRLEHSAIMEELDKTKAKAKIVIADACHAGSFNAEKGSSNFTLDNFYEAFKRTKGGTAIMLSSKAEETSIESNGLRQGIFSHFLIRGLKGSADVDNNTIITLQELFNYVEANVNFYTNGYQTPVLQGDFDKNLPIGMVRE